MAIAPLVALGIGSLVAGVGSSALQFGQAAKAKRESAEAVKRAEAEQAEARRKNESWFNKEYYTNYLDRADTQNIIGSLRRNLAEQAKINRQSAKISGATDESAIAADAQNAKAVSDTYANIASGAQQFRDRVLDRYLGMSSKLSDQAYQHNMNMAGSHATSATNALSGAASTLSGAVNSAANIAMSNVKPVPGQVQPTPLKPLK